MRRYPHSFLAKRPLAALAAAGLCLALSPAVLFPAVAFASETTKDISQGSITCSDTNTTYRITGTATNTNHVTIKGGSSESKPVVVVLDDLTITQSNKVDAHDAPITVESGYALIKLEGESHLTAGRDDISLKHDEGRAGIHVASDAHLTITSASGDGSSDGTLYAQGGDNGSKGYGGAGIGSNYDHDSGSITINGGTIFATGGKCSAGIGSGRDGVCTSVTINGGTITATGRDKAAGIGGGNQEGTGKGGHTDSVIITGGTITATGGSDSTDGGAGVGGSNGDVDTIRITGGTVTATGGKGGAGVGGGSDSKVDSITIENATVTAVGGSNAAGIGSGNSQNVGDGGSCEGIDITDSTVTATGGTNGAGIGCGDDGSVGNIFIAGGKVTATGGSNAAGIGAGHAAGAGSGGKFHHILIHDSSNYPLDLTATASGSGAAGIGGAGQNGGNIGILLDGGTITATGTRHGAGIGGGGKQNGDITISGNGTINATAGYDACAIGAGNQCHADTITIKGDSLSGPAYGEGAAYALTINAKILGDNDNPDCNAAIIGSGDGTSNDITITNTLLNYSTDSYWQSGAIVGTGHSWDMSFHDGGIDTITLNHVKLVDKGCGVCRGAGIGAGDRSTINHISLDEVDYDGPTIGSCTPSQLFFDNGRMDSIKISNSKIKALALGWDDEEYEAENDPRAGIGTGAYGGISSITITNSEITARGAQGGAGIGSGGMVYRGGVNPEEYEVSLREAWTARGKVGSISISGSNVAATGAFGGAGIGSGTLTSVTGSITIDNSTVEADGTSSGELFTSACGIGAGYLCGCGDIIITDSDVKAYGGAYSAGIGASGYEENNIFADFMTGWWDESVGDITITRSTVLATAGENAAGIGSGECTHADESTFTITDSEVTATGGDYGAGIGAGPEKGIFQFGGDSGTIIIQGDSIVKATGGRGAAGIGGGFSGAANKIVLSLTQDPQYYVWAQGGDGAAGIGAGCAAGNIDSSGRDAHNITINSGFIYAQGGVDMDNSTLVDKPSEYHPWGFIGAGAGIGGGSMHGTSNVIINGGVIVAHAGKPNSASPGAKPQDIGSGGDNYKNEFATGRSTVAIHDGTVIAGLTTDNDITITGGSVSHQVGGSAASSPKAKNGSGDRVYQTTLTLDTSSMTALTFGESSEVFYKAKLSDLSDISYGSDYIYALSSGTDRGKIYLYMVESEENAAWVDVAADNEDLHYYGTTAAGSNNNVLKMGSSIQLVPDETTPVAFPGTAFRLNVEPTNSTLGEGSVDFRVTKGEDFVSINAENSVTTTPNAYLVLDCLAKGNFTATARADGGFDSELYWDATAIYSGTVGSANAALAITDDPSKEYDGSAVSDPAVVLYDENGPVEAGTYEVAYTYYDSEDSELEGAPIEPGSYSVTASAAATENRDEAHATREFQISKGHLTASVTTDDKTYDGQPASATLSVVTSTGVDASSEYQLVYRQLQEDGSWKTVDEATNAGTYRAVVAIPGSEHYFATGARASFAIAKAAPDATTPTVSVYDLADYPDGLTLKDVELEGGVGTVAGKWDWVDKPTTPLFEGEHSFAIRFTPEDAGNYTSLNSSVTVKVIDSSKANWDITIDDPAVHELSERVDEAHVPLNAGTINLAATVHDINGKVVTNAQVTYEVAKGEDVLSIDSAGKATVKQAGKAWVKITVAEATSNSLITRSAAGGITYVETVELVRVIVEKGVPAINLERPDKVYDGKPAEASVSIDDSAYPVRYTGTPEITYWKQDESGAYNRLNGAPTKPGLYKVEVMTPEDDNYSAAEAAREFVIYPKGSDNPDDPDDPTDPDDPDNPDNPDNPDKSHGNGRSTMPTTGDSALAIMGIASMLLAAGLIAVLAFAIPRRRATT